MVHIREYAGISVSEANMVMSMPRELYRSCCDTLVVGVYIDSSLADNLSTHG